MDLDDKQPKNNQQAIANIKAILDSDVGRLMREDPKLGYGPAVKKAGRAFCPGAEEWLKNNCMRVGEWGEGKENRLVSLYWATYSHLIQRLAMIGTDADSFGEEEAKGDDGGS